jgi:hypothetical protein
MAMNATKNGRGGSVESVTIRAIRSQYEVGAWSAVRAVFHWRFSGARATVSHERIAMAAAHRVAADLLDAAPTLARWSLPNVDLVTSYSDVVQTAIEVELARGTDEEKDAALNHFHDVIPAPEA